VPKGKRVNFRSKDAYRRWLAFKHIHLPGSRTDEQISIRGKAHKVKHSGR
jgi:hypothetical protein